MEKAAGNYCEYFEMGRRAWAGPKIDSAEDKARKALRDLLG
jgi:hypothetical protein